MRHAIPPRSIFRKMPNDQPIRRETTLAEYFSIWHKEKILAPPKELVGQVMACFFTPLRALFVQPGGNTHNEWDPTFSN